ncbi:MAG: hypothetical protein HUU50_00255 [Candidatus Brocadiae bacterium]|nr:hypothetical protein [Candidatus Brocadiia bacterium]
MNHREYLTKLIGKECQYEKYGRGALLTYNKISEEQNIENDIIYESHTAKILEVHEDFIVLEYCNGTIFSIKEYDSLYNSQKKQTIPVKKIIRLEDVAINYYSEKKINEILSNERDRYKKEKEEIRRSQASLNILSIDSTI